jgi:glycosyltransferase involved in cell wall biosynthesis
MTTSPTPSPAVTVVILTHNEERHIERCIRSIRAFSPDIAVIDSFSTDRTREIAESLGARVYQNPWINYATQLNWALRNVPISTPWTMRWDADEYATPELATELRDRMATLPSDVTGIYLKRRVHFLGRWIRHGGCYPTVLLRLWRTGMGACEERWMDEHMVLSGGTTVQCDHDFVDDNLNYLTWWTTKHNSYANREAVDLFNMKYDLLATDEAEKLTSDSQERRKRALKESVYSRLPLFFRAWAYSIYRYVFRLGFLDGVPGLVWHVLQGFWYRFLVDAKIYQVEQYAKRQGVSIREAIKEVLGISV